MMVSIRGTVRQASSLVTASVGEGQHVELGFCQRARGWRSLRPDALCGLGGRLHESSESLATDQSIAVAAISADASEASNPPTLSSSVSVSAS